MEAGHQRIEGEEVVGSIGDYEIAESPREEDALVAWGASVEDGSSSPGSGGRPWTSVWNERLGTRRSSAR
jgi:hypothetical protein